MTFELHENEYSSINDNLNFEDYFTYKKIRTNKQITYYNDVIAFDIEATSFNDYQDIREKDTEVYKHLSGTKIKITQQQYEDIKDLSIIRRSLFGRIYLSKTSGINIDSLYSELISLFPYWFKDDIINPSDQLERILTVFIQNLPEKTEDTKRAVMYVWQLAINGRVIIGRTWKEFTDLLEQISVYFKLQSDKRMIIFVHNLSYEMAFLQSLFTWEKVFAIDTHKPIYALTTSGFEFRCSYLLSNMSLANLGLSLKKYKVNKLVGDLDYDLIRHNKTKLSKREINYCINDVLVVSAYIKEAIEAEGNDITKLPLTSTGYCRRHMRVKCLSGKGKQGQKEQFNKYHNMIKYLKINGLEEYELLRNAFCGGYCVSGALHSKHTVYDVDSYDLTSAYPAAMVLYDSYPMSKGKKVEITSYKQFDEMRMLYCMVFEIKFINIKPKLINANYLSLSKCRDENDKPFTKETREKYHMIVNNGRVVSCDILCTSMNEIDYSLCEKFYSWDAIEIGTCYQYKRGRLPKEIVESVLDLYSKKTTLKGSESDYDIDMYQRSKGLLNACYGMICQRLVQDVHYYDNEKGWSIEHKNAEAEIKRYNNSKKRFLFYPWSLYITSLVRKTICDGIIDGFGDSFLYADTDSIKAYDAESHEWYIREYNNIVLERAKEAAAYYNLPLDMFMPKSRKGETKLIGVFEKETEKGKWAAFRSLGSKRYLYLTHDHKLVLTVSGVNKRIALPYLISKYGKYGVFKYFNEDLVIPADYTGKLTHYYLEDEYTGEVEDYQGHVIKYRSKSGVYLEKTSYSFSMERAYIEYLKEVQENMIYEIN